MQKYKNLILITASSIFLVFLVNILEACHAPLDVITTKFLNTASFIAQLLTTYTLIVVLNIHKESIWRKIPFYMLIIAKIFSYYVIPVLTTKIAKHFGSAASSNNYTVLLGFVGIFYVVLFLFLIIGCFRVKSRVIARYFRLYGVATILSGFLVIVFRMAFRWAYGVYLQDGVILLPILVTLWMHYKLYVKYEFFTTGDTVITTADHENIPAGSLGIITQKHNSSFFDVEFLDDNGNLMNVLSMSADDLRHASALSLADRVEAFKQAQ